MDPRSQTATHRSAGRTSPPDAALPANQASQRAVGASPKARRTRMLIDMLGERMAFEQTGVRMYDALLGKCRVAGSGLDDSEISMLSYFRDQEAQHLALAASAIQQLGGDIDAATPGAALVAVQCGGLMQAVSDPRATLAQSLRVMFDAELIDNASWELLIPLTRSAGHADLAERFEAALRQEAAHLRTVKHLAARTSLVEAGLDARK